MKILYCALFVILQISLIYGWGLSEGSMWEEYDVAFNCTGKPNGKYVHPTDCTKFVLCDDDITIESDCPAGYHFDKKTLKCVEGDCPKDEIESIECGGGSSTNPPGPTDPTVPTVPTDPTSPIPSPSTTIEPPEFYVYAVETLEFHASKEDCNAYYFCCNNKPVRMRCSPDQHWNQNATYCDTKENAGCNTDGGGGDKPLQCRPDEVHYLPDPADCSKYVYCVYGTRYPQSCPYPKHFDYLQLKCLPRNEAHCYPNPTTPKPFYDDY